MALWWGALTVVGFCVVPLLFAYLETAQAAGRMAAVLFKLQNNLTVACGLVLLVSLRTKGNWVYIRHRSTAMILIAIAMLLAIATNGVLAPKIVARETLRLWHTLGSLAYLGQWVAVTALIWLRQSDRHGDKQH